MERKEAEQNPGAPMPDRSQENEEKLSRAEDKSAEATMAEIVPCDQDKPVISSKHKPRIKVPGFIKRRRKPQPETCDTDSSVEAPCPAVVLDFEENLKQKHLAEASQQLIAQEESLFGSATEENQEGCKEEEEEKLQRAYEVLMVQVWMAVHDSFFEDNQETLRSAMTVILQEEEQDKRWLEVQGRSPEWRPRRCRQHHDMLLQKIVEARLKRAEEEAGAEELSTSMKREVCRMGKRIQKDLLKVLSDLTTCYSQEFDVFGVYAHLYHQAFSSRLVELAHSSLSTEDCIYVLCWVNCFYPEDVLQHKELKTHISNASLGPLIPKEDLTALEEQYLSHIEDQVRRWLSNALKKEEETWQSDSDPMPTDEYYHCLLAIDVVQIFKGTMREAQAILGEAGKAQRILWQLDGFLTSYKKSLEEFLKGKQENNPAVVKANLVNIEQLRDYLVEKEPLLPEEVKARVQASTADLQDCCHRYFIRSIHEELKPQYRRLWTQTWFLGSHEILDKLLDSLEEKLQQFGDLKPSCREGLISQLHFEVMVEYVKRLLKRKLKLRDKEQQETAARLMCEESAALNGLFTEAGSQAFWLADILPKLSEVLRLQDPSLIQLEIATAVQRYPDLSDKHVHCLLYLKWNLSSGDIRRIKETLSDTKDSLNAEAATPFFINVSVKGKMPLDSLFVGKK